VDDDESINVLLENRVKEGQEGDYKLKVKLLKKGRKTTYDKTRDIYLNVPEIISDKETKEEVLNKDSDEEESVLEINKIIRKDDIVYESETFKIRKLIPFFILILFIFSVIFSLIAFRKQD
jgi:hypothetical protein